jgi:PEGA domain
MSKNPVLIAFVVCILLLSSLAQVQTVQPTSQVPVTAGALTGPMLEDGTPIKLRIARTVSSADAHVGDTVDFEVLEEVHVGNLLVIPKGGTAWATVTEAQSKRRMARGGKLDMNIDSVRLVDGEKIALRAVKEVKGGGHTGAMTGAMVGTAIVFFPAAPPFLFMHGKDITIPKGTEITAYINGNFPINLAKFQSPAGVAPATTVAATGVTTELDLSSTPAGAEIGIDGNFVGNTPSSPSVVAGDHTISIKLAGYQLWERTIHT